MGTSGTESRKGCLQTQCNQLPPQLALKLSLVGLLTSWLVIGIINLVSNFIRLSRVELWNEVETSCHKSSDAHE